MGFTNRFIGTHTRCLAVERDENDYLLTCDRSYGHDDPKNKKPTDHYDSNTEKTWPSERLKRACRKEKK